MIPGVFHHIQPYTSQDEPLVFHLVQLLQGTVIQLYQDILQFPLYPTAAPFLFSSKEHSG